MKIAIIGAGAMGGAICRGLLKLDAASAAAITLSDPSPEALSRFGATGVALMSDNRRAAAGADVVMVVVKPWLVEQVVKDIRPVMSPRSQTLVVVAAGVSSAQLDGWLRGEEGETMPFFLAIPNIAVEQLCSMTFVVPVGASDGQTAQIVELFSRMGQTLVVEERLLPAATTLASCGIAYAMRYVRAATEGGVEIGFKSADACAIVLQTVLGAVRLLQQDGTHPETEIDKVTTPGGVTIRGLNEMEHAGFTSAVVRGIKAGLKQ